MPLNLRDINIVTTQTIITSADQRRILSQNLWQGPLEGMKQQS